MLKWYKVKELEGCIGITEIHHFKESSTAPAVATIYKLKVKWFAFIASDVEKESKCMSVQAAKIAAELML